MRPWIALLLLGLCSQGWGCKRPEPIPTDKRLVAKAPVAPGIDELKPHKNANRKIYQGDVYAVVQRLPEFEWEAMLDDQVLRRKGAVEVKRAELDGPTFAFDSDFIEAEVPTPAWMCARMGNPSVFGMPCPQTLRSIVAQKGRLISYATCAEPSCPLAELSAGAVTTTTVAGLSEVRVVSFGAHSLVLVWSRWMRAPAWTGGSLLLMQLSPPLARAGEILLDEADAREPARVINRLGTLEILGDGLRFSGTRYVRELESGKELSAEPVDERFGIGQDGRLVRR